MTEQDSKLEKVHSLFTLGLIVVTSGVMELVKSGKIDNWQIADLIRRHVGGDWTQMDKEDMKSNFEAVRKHYRILSAYTIEINQGGGFFGKEKIKFWVITEADRSSTTVLLPDEY